MTGKLKKYGVATRQTTSMTISELEKMSLSCSTEASQEMAESFLEGGMSMTLDAHYGLAQGGEDGRGPENDRGRSSGADGKAKSGRNKNRGGKDDGNDDKDKTGDNEKEKKKKLTAED